MQRQGTGIVVASGEGNWVPDFLFLWFHTCVVTIQNLMKCNKSINPTITSYLSQRKKQTCAGSQAICKPDRSLLIPSHRLLLHFSPATQASCELLSLTRPMVSGPLHWPLPLLRHPHCSYCLTSFPGRPSLATVSKISTPSTLRIPHIPFPCLLSST